MIVVCPCLKAYEVRLGISGMVVEDGVDNINPQTKKACVALRKSTHGRGWGPLCTGTLFAHTQICARIPVTTPVALGAYTPL